MEQAKAKDKYIVSFNSDTSDSEDEGGDDEVTTSTNSDDHVTKATGSSASSSGHMTNGAPADPERVGSTKQKLISGGGARGQEFKAELRSNGPMIDLICADEISGTVRLAKGSGVRSGAQSKADTATDILVDITGSPAELNSRPKLSGDILNAELQGLSITCGAEQQQPGDGRSLERISHLEAPLLDRKTKPKDCSDLLSSATGSNQHQSRPLVNGTDNNNVKGFDILDDDAFAVENKHKTDILDADILIYASPGSASSSADFRSADKRPRRSRSFDSEPPPPGDRSLTVGTFERQSSKPEGKVAYDDLDEKFSAICSKYGKETKRTRQRTLANDGHGGELGPGDELCGVVRVKTGPPDTDGVPESGAGPRGVKVGRDPEQEAATAARQKITFDDMVRWDKSSTDELIKRILADAHDKATTADAAATDRSRDGYEGGRRLPEPYETEMGGARPYRASADEPPSLLERRLASLVGPDKPAVGDAPTAIVAYDPYGSPGADDPERLYTRRSRGAKLGDADDDVRSVSSDASGGYVPWRRRQKAASGRYPDSLALALPRRYDDSDSDSESYVSRRSAAPALPDDCFKPEKSEDTDAVVRERTSEVRAMVDNQAEVLGRLKKASDSFDELEAEIKQLKQEMMESHIARQTIIEDIMADIEESAAAAAAVPDDEALVPYPTRYSRHSLRTSDNGYGAYSYSSPYGGGGARSGRSRDAESCSRLDTDLESDRLGGYALGAVAKSKWGEPGGSRAFRSASVCRFDNVESEKYDKYGLYSAPSVGRRWPSAVGDGYDAKSDFGIEVGDDAETASIKSYPSEKSADDRSDDADLAPSTKYRSRYAIAKYGSLSGRESPSRYGTPSYTSATRPSRSSSLYRSYPIGSTDLSYDRPRIRAGSVPPPDGKPFTSRFLSKVREKRASGEYTKPSRDRPFRSRFLARSFDSGYGSVSSSSRASLASTPDSSSPRSQRARDSDVTGTTSNEGDATAEKAN